MRALSSFRPLLAILTVASGAGIVSVTACTSDEDNKCQTAECLGTLDASLPDGATLDARVDANDRTDAAPGEDASTTDSSTTDSATTDATTDATNDATADANADAADAGVTDASTADANDGGPHAIATPVGPWRIAVGGGYVYATTAGDIAAVPTGGGATTTITQGGTIDWVAADANNVYFTASGRVYKRAHGGNTNTPISNTFVASQPFGLTVDATHVYWSEDLNGGAVRRVKIDGSLLAGEAVSPALLYPRGIAFYNGAIYVGESDGTVIGGGRIIRLNPDGGAPFPIAQNITGASKPVVDSTPRIYWYENGGGNGPVRSAPLPDGGTIAQHAGTAIDPSFVTDGNTFYYGNATGGIVKINVTNASATTLYNSGQTGNVYGLAISGSSLYWTDYAGNRIMTAPK